MPPHPADVLVPVLDALTARPLPPGDSAAWRAFVAELDGAAAADVPVLIQGEPGTGKGRAARALHDRGPRRGRAFVPLAGPPDAAALLARGGTLGLFRVETLAATVHHELMRTLPGRPGPGDARAVATASGELAVAVVRGRFPAGLFYRLAGRVLRVPPLRDRPDDVPLLAADAAARYGPPGARLADAAVGRLRRYPWPGNLRELDDLIARACVRSPGAAVIDVPAGWLDGGVPAAGDERSTIVAALARAGGVVRHAAEALGWPRSTLRNRMRRHNVRADDPLV